MLLSLRRRRPLHRIASPGSVSIFRDTLTCDVSMARAPAERKSRRVNMSMASFDISLLAQWSSHRWIAFASR